MGSIFSLFMLSLTFDTELYTYVTWMFLGVVALGFGFAYISRMGEVSTIYTEDYTEVKEAIIEQQRGGGQAQIEAIPEPVLTDNGEEEEEVEMIEESEEEEVEVIEESEDYDEDGIEDEDFDFSELDEEEEDAEVSEDLESKKEVEKKIEKKKSTQAIPEPVTSAFDYDLILDPTISQAIQNSLANTPHEGFKPVVSVSQNGSLKIDFVPI